ncbi:MAG: hypothetical protein CMM52_16355 [Rhodospirillaceae bacterium]|nr:hypothetical protein [Rhodospirillaceae bacterium]|tara:strand:+ start:33886 stop:34077 length:192 start_codon:yes stop_codon:yes gene_type:complete
MTGGKKDIRIEKPANTNTAETESAQPAKVKPSDTGTPKEHGGREGPDPTRFGDWEKNGRCIDF